MKKIGIIISIFALIAIGCKQTAGEQEKVENSTMEIQDTVITKQNSILTEPSSYTKSYSYYWITGKDTLDFRLNARQLKEGSLYISISHNKPMSFADALKKTEECLPLLQEDFDVSEITSINFRAPIFYLDLAKRLSDEYKQLFERENIPYEKLNDFLLQSSMTSQLNDFLSPLDKEVKYYGLEKAFIIDKKDYKLYLPDVDFAAYPEFTFNAHTGISVSLENKNR
ncbi:hypothetical protein [Dysgonomonas sp. 25]|uniref:hypothetical protein n=1 Tax=Dysgonomonas sp. 25 TaxID=2302933 RepID=UPI0013D7AE4E|nr:hypothetical protein [Dysgonomonas sp. 25]NDV70344.1 hypothetical protein [Dysgonomonas sp. 25]